MVRDANHYDKNWITDLLTRSFNTNKSVNFVVKQGIKREQRIRKLMEYSFEICLASGKAFVTENRKACALVFFPDRKKMNLKVILLNLKLVFFSIGFFRISKVMKREAAIKRNYPTHPIFYLWFLGVDPQEQGKGMGTRLLKDIIQASKAMHRPLYLETSTPLNIPFYQRQGFEIYKELHTPHHLFLLRRNLD